MDEFELIATVKAEPELSEILLEPEAESVSKPEADAAVLEAAAEVFEEAPPAVESAPALSVKEQVLAALKEFGISTLMEKSTALEDFYAIGRLPNTTREKPFFTFDLKTTTDKATVIPLTDIHLGSKFSLVDKFKAYIDYILRTPNTYAVVLGDVMENATKTSVGLGMFEEEYHLEDQVKQAYRLLRPLADTGKLIGIHTGNHEQRTSLLVQLNPMKLVAERLHVPYFDWQAYHLWTVGDQKYKIHTHHGAGKATTPSGRLNQVLKMRNISRADLFLMGHVHDILDYETKMYDWDEEAGTMKEIVQKYAVCGSLLSYHFSYAEQGMMAPVSQRLIKIDLYKDRHDIKIYK